MINSKNRHIQFRVLILLVVAFFSTAKVCAQTYSEGQLTLTTPAVNGYYIGDKVTFTLKDLAFSDGWINPSYYYEFEWNTDLYVLNSFDNYTKEIEVLLQDQGEKLIYVNYRDGQYWYSASIRIVVQNEPGTPEVPIVVTTSCRDVVLQRSDPPANSITNSQDIIWYWQSTPAGTSMENSEPTITLNSGTEYFLRAKLNYGSGAWSANSRSVQYEFNQVSNWYLDADGDSLGNPIYAITQCTDPSTANIKYVQDNTDTNDGVANFSLDDGVLPNSDTEFHWTHQISYDAKGLVTGVSRTYFDDLGKADVSLSKDMVSKKVWGTETTYDDFGRADKSSFVAPSNLATVNKVSFFTAPAQTLPSAILVNQTVLDITSNQNIQTSQTITATGAVSSGLNVNFIAGNSIILSPGFSVSGATGGVFTATIAAPPIASASAQLTNYYSDSNALEPYQATAEQPYSQTNYDILNPGNVINVVGGNKIGGDWKTGYSYSVPAAQEMYYVYGHDYYEGALTANGEEVITKFYKSVSVDANGVENVAFSDGEGKVLASARSGGATTYPVVSLIGTQGFVDVHIPAGITSGISLIGGASLYKVYDLKTGLITTSLSGGNAYRIEALAPPTTDPKVYISNGVPTPDAGALGISYSVNYYDYSVNVYNKTGQLIKSIQPNGFQLNNPIVASPAYLNSGKFTSTYTYNTLGQVIQTSSPDEGSSQFAYRQDGQIRYSQSALQAPLNKISYTNYDSYGRPIESGVVTGAIWTDALAGADATALIGTQLSERTFTVYDDTENTATSSQIPTPYSITIPSNLSLATLAPSYIQNNLSGNVAVTYKADSGTTINAITWYGYDIYGRSEWMVQYNEGIGTKTIHYEYDYKGNVKKVLYQKNNSAELFVHQYTYDANDVLKKVETSTDNTTFITHADYSYYLTGELKRVNIAQGGQGTDYVYTLGGQLKSINHPSLEAAKDPGGDSNDVFGITLDYYSGDYLRTGRNIISSPTAGADYNGNIKAARWANKGVAGDFNGTTASQKGYLYTYDRNNFLSTASYGTADTSTAAIAATTNYKEGNLTYDANGNLKTLQRTNATGAMQDDLSYAYNTDKNQLNSVADAAGSSTNTNDIGTQAAGNYEYDAIGQMTRNVLEDIDYAYNTQGLVTQVSKAGHPVVKFFYNERGQRIKKESYATTGTFGLVSTDYYILDLSGNAMAIYNQPNSSGIVQKDLPIFGLSRLGVYNRASATSNYEIKDHLGNVRAVVQKVGSSPVIQSFADYYPFGEQLPMRNSLSNYRYAFQGQELDGETNMEAFQLRLWDGRIGRWLSPDPYGQYASPYLGMGNNPISSIDPDGGWETKFGAWWHSLWNGGTVFQSEKNGDWGVRTVTGNGSSISDGVNISTTFGGKRFDVFRQQKVEAFLDAQSTYRALHPSEFGDISLWDDKFQGNRLQSIASAFQLANPVLPGMNSVGLADDVAKTFQNGRYREITLKEPIVLSRYYDNVSAFAKGRFMTNSISGSKFLDRMGLALRPKWNGMTKVASWEIPAGTTIYKGKAAMQFPWIGGKTQYFVPELGNINRVINK